MSSDPTDGGGPIRPDDGTVLARIVGRYFDPTESVTGEDLRDGLREAVPGTLVSVEPEDVGVVVVVERASSETDAPTRHSYMLEHATGMDGEPTLEWTYLGPAD